MIKESETLSDNASEKCVTEAKEILVLELSPNPFGLDLSINKPSSFPEIPIKSESFCFKKIEALHITPNYRSNIIFLVSLKFPDWIVQKYMPLVRLPATN